MLKRAISQSDLHGNWVHAYEEDTQTEMVFRPSSHPLPRSRGRTAFDLHEDKTCIFLGIARDDRHEPYSGSWDFDDQTATLSLHFPDGTHQVLSVESAKKDKLVVKKPTLEKSQ